jgi:hypothetical protein
MKHIFFLLLLPTTLLAQFKLPAVEGEVGGIVNSEEQKAFWILSNNNGRYKPQGNTAFASVKLFSDTSRFNTFGELPASDSAYPFHFDYGLHAMNIYNGSNRVQLQEYFAEAGWKWFHLSAGAKKRSFGLQYQPLSAGGLLFSENARPMPELALSSDYIPVPFTHKLLEIKGYFSHGWFEKERYVDLPYLHHKNLYARLGADWPLTIEYGFEHYAMWGGQSPQYGQINNSMKDYLRVFLATSGEQIANEAKNAYGNHLGSQNIKITWNSNKFELSASWQTIFEDGSGKRMENIKDGLWGLHFRNKNQKSIICNANLEFLHTMHQSGRFHVVDSSIVGGNDNYFNNYLYKDGWTYHDYILGTPFISSPALTGTKNKGSINNRVIAWHLGINGYIIPKLSYRAMASWSRNYGINGQDISPGIHQTSWIIELAYQFPRNWTLRAAAAMDHGKLYRSGFSSMLSVSRLGIF